MPTTVAPDLRAIYRSLYDTLPWPEPIPSPAQVTFRWDSVYTSGLGSCALGAKIIRINRLYQDERLHGELDDVMAHEASHFIWPNHSSTFKKFLRRAGVSERYCRAKAPLSETFRTVAHEWFECHVSYGTLRPRQVTQIEFPFED
jgi:hypothetical protein